MNITYHKQELSEILADLSVLTGTEICFVDTEFRFLLGHGPKSQYCYQIQERETIPDKCRCSDTELLLQCQESRRAECRLCHGGLGNVAMPVIKNDLIVGYVLIGCLRTSSSPKEPPYLSAPDDPLLHSYEIQPFFSDAQLDSLMHLLPRILFQNAIQIEYDSFISRVVDFIAANLHRELSIQEICAQLHVSKNYLYESFHAYYGCTVNEFITSRRIQKAQMLLKETSEPVYKIAELIGIENYTYFCKLFKRKTGLSPGQYRRLHQTS